ncbi:DUF5325 family protein [Alkalihalobacterium chitinilyticum]|uniref:YlaF family protein n=1 Tax=Alkalihalobacterium chitinilyticum TaxID=2980103 RepID=A0ABT5VCE9_9BACI|nr:DUF5325 family protein [Alkalihalobacterium chitinilyticum]MDE5413121.1 YlaF family protein [Alkalihalobacterium chitinilyticum]
MKKENILFLTLAIVTVIGIMAIGVAIAERSILIGILSLLGITVACGMGFSLRKKLRETEEI